MTETWSKQEAEAIIDSYVRKVIDFDRLVAIFKLKRFTNGYVPDNTDAYVVGSWDAVERAWYRNVFTKVQFMEIAVNDMLSRDE